LYCQRCGSYNEESFAYCHNCGYGLKAVKDKNKLLWIVLIILIGLPLLTILLSFILYIMVMGFG
jgi:zinc-ribbon domain